MYNKSELDKFSDLVVKIGVNLQKGQGIEICCPVERHEVAEAIAEASYRAGAGIVRVRWNSDNIDRINFENATTENLIDIPKWTIDSKYDLLKKGFCYVSIYSENPLALKNVPPEKLSEYVKVKSKLLKRFSDSVMDNSIRWCVVSVPTYEWAKQVFPDEEKPMEKLWKLISKTMRLDYPDPVDEWQKHIERLDKHAEFMNKMNFEYLHFENNIGTDINIGLAENHVWLSAREKAKDGVDFVANMPTEEIFTAPHIRKINGVIKSCMPLCYNGNIIDNFSLTFKKGKIVDFSAEKGYDVLKHLIDTDKGTKSIGEVALIGKHSPIAESKTLFYNTLFDENASCHVAIGKAYPTTVKNGDKMTISELKKMGANDSMEHVDFMVGTSDLKVTGIKYNGEKVRIFDDGEWVI